MPKPAPPRQSWLARIPIWALVIMLGAALTGAIAYAATRPQNGRPAPPPPVASSGSRPSATPSASTLPTADPASAPSLPELEAAVAEIEARHWVNLGVAIAPLSPVGQARMAAYEAGTIRNGEAWATIDIAIALAVKREPKQPEDLNYLLNRAIIESSPAADDALWSFLGSAEDASDKVEAILREAGDVTTVVRSTSSDPQVPAYATSLWSNREQARFGAAIYCMPGTWTVMNRMDDQPAADRWGLGRLPRTQFKGGSGTQPNGTVLLRQFGAVTLGDGSRVGVGLAAVARSGGESAAKEAANELADALYNHATGFAGSCE